jgi:hypothetical protein
VVKGYVGALVFCAFAYWFVVQMLNTFRARGYVTRFS